MKININCIYTYMHLHTYEAFVICGNFVYNEREFSWKRNIWEYLWGMVIRILCMQIYCNTLYIYRYREFDQGTTPRFSTPQVIQITKFFSIWPIIAPISVSYVPYSCPDIFFVGAPFVVDPITGSCERILRNKRTVKMSCYRTSLRYTRAALYAITLKAN